MSTWYPSRYGADDEAGALNEITPDAVVAAAGPVRAGRVFDLAHVLHADVPAFPGRTFAQVLQPDQDPTPRATPRGSRGPGSTWRSGLSTAGWP